MRYADGPSTQAEIRLNAETDRVWNLVTDVMLPARFSPELQQVRWLDGATGPALGARFEGHNQHSALGDWKTVSQVVELRAPHTFGWAVVDAYGRFGEGPADPENPAALWRFSLVPEPGGLLLRQAVRIGPGRSGLSWVIERLPDNEEEIIEHRLAELRAGMQATLRGIKALVEQAAPSSLEADSTQGA